MLYIKLGQYKPNKYKKYLIPPASRVNTTDAAKHGKYVIITTINAIAEGNGILFLIVFTNDASFSVALSPRE